MMARAFGFLPDPIHFESRFIDVGLRPNFQATVDHVLSSQWVHDGWFYPPLQSRQGSDGTRTDLPCPSLRFELPTTHILSHRRTSSVQRMDFLICVIGFLVGICARPEGYGYLLRTPVSRGKLIDLVVAPSEIARCLDVADGTWLSSTLEQRLLMRSAINALQLAHAYQHQYEELTFTYSALDACYRVARLTGLLPGRRDDPHWERARRLCRTLGIPTPIWARQIPGASASSRLSRLRNPLAHEALFADEPLGYAVDKSGVLLQLQALVSRCIVHLLGIGCRYTRTRVTTRQMHGLDLHP